jgi:hypothetical protein
MGLVMVGNIVALWRRKAGGGSARETFNHEGHEGTRRNPLMKYRLLLERKVRKSWMVQFGILPNDLTILIGNFG